jgi:branched-chain amino acid transport system substrate-binding protein
MSSRSGVRSRSAARGKNPARSSLAACLVAAFGMAAGAAQGQITVGATVATSGPGAALGIPQKNAYELLPTKIGDQTVRYVMLDDGGDPRLAVQNVRKMIESDKVDVILGSGVTPVSLATAVVAEQNKTPQISLAPVPTRPWLFSATPSHATMVAGIVGHMKKNGAKTAAFIGYGDALGDEFLKQLQALSEPAGIKVVATERYARNDSSVMAQVLKIMQTQPDAVFVGAGGTPSVLPHATLVERGYKGRIYHSHAAAVPDFLRVGGKQIEGAILPTGPVIIANLLPDAHPIKKKAEDFIRLYEQKYGKDTANYISAVSYDGGSWLQVAAPIALKKAKPGTEEFRVALRDALESSIKGFVGTTTMSTVTPQDHTGADERSRVMARVENGRFTFLE